VKNEFDEWWEQQPESGTGGISTLNFLRVQFQALAFRAWLAGRSLLTLEEQRKVIGGNKMDLSKHEKYCRLSNTENKLCVCKLGVDCIPSDKISNIISSDWTRCPRPQQQQAVETPNPLEELIEETWCSMTTGFVKKADMIKALREFAEKVRVI